MATKIAMDAVMCHRCEKPAQGKDGFCKGCRIAAYVVVKYRFTADLDERLRKAYREHGRLSGKIRAIDDLVKVTGWPRWVFRNRALRMGWCQRQYTKWTAEQVELLEEMAGSVGLRMMSNRLGLPMAAIAHKLQALGLSRVVAEGYTRHQLSNLMGVKQARINEWIGRGWLLFDEVDERVPQASVERFLWKYMEKYRFASCEEWWLKRMLNPRLGDGVRREAA